ncbi:MAG: hypothetical protein LCH38_09645 [Proteobacteria bacterium]|nr:hypothetical protein [Pseudomonadota bacterium]
MKRAFALLFALPGVALAHSWYPYECCSDNDCFPVAVENVKNAPGGWVLEDGTFIRYQEARASPDGKYHVCRHNNGKGALISVYGKAACFWAPMGSS